MDDVRAGLATFYESEAAGGFRRGPAGRRVELREEFVQLLLSEHRSLLLDVGAGPGTDAPAFLEAGIGYLGVDLAFGNAALSAAVGSPVLQASLFDLPLRTGSFDAGWTMSTLLHVPDAEFDLAMTAISAPFRSGSPVAIGLWGGRDEELISEEGAVGLPRFFSLRSHDRIQHMLAEHGDIERFETWGSAATDWEYQYAVLRMEH